MVYQRVVGLHAAGQDTDNPRREDLCEDLDQGQGQGGQGCL